MKNKKASNRRRRLRRRRRAMASVPLSQETGTPAFAATDLKRQIDAEILDDTLEAIFPTRGSTSKVKASSEECIKAFKALGEAAKGFPKDFPVIQMPTRWERFKRFLDRKINGV